MYTFIMIYELFTNVLNQNQPLGFILAFPSSMLTNIPATVENLDNTRLNVYILLAQSFPHMVKDPSLITTLPVSSPSILSPQYLHVMLICSFARIPSLGTTFIPGLVVTETHNSTAALPASSLMGLHSWGLPSH